jgi:hypothetical protein
LTFFFIYAEFADQQQQGIDRYVPQLKLAYFGLAHPFDIPVRCYATVPMLTAEVVTLWYFLEMILGLSWGKMQMWEASKSEKKILKRNVVFFGRRHLKN